MKRKRTTVVVVLVVAIGAAAAVWSRFFKPALPPAERGRRIAEAQGCFNCHGPGGLHGAANPGREYPEVPNFRGDVMMYAKDADAVREWIRDGVPAAKAKSESWQRDRDAGALVMPAFGERLSEGEIEDLVAFVLAVSGASIPEDAPARRGYERARDLGCFGCHGPGGRLAPPNPGSLKGYIPSWDGNDFGEIVQGREEFDEWVRDGISRRFRESSIARNYVERANIVMPPYDRFLEPGDLEALWAYVEWLRARRE